MEKNKFSRSRSVEVSELAFIDRARPASLERQITTTLRQSITTGKLAPGARLPSTRRLCEDLGVSRTIAGAAYAQLIAEGYLESRHGSGTYVAFRANPAPSRRKTIRPAQPPHDVPEPAIFPPADDGYLEFRVCQPCTAHFPASEWRRAWMRACSEPVPDDYADPRGSLFLREGIARRVERARGMHVEAADMLITSGGIQAIALIARLFVTPGTRVAFENPCYPLAHQIFLQAGADILPIEVDSDGLDVARLPDGVSAPKLVYVTPAHQFPTGERLSLARRLALLSWAERNGAFIIEDDYDGEYRYDAEPLPPLASLDENGRVIYVGTFSKTLTPSLRIGFAVAAPAVLQNLLRLKTMADYHSPVLPQSALASFIESGALDRHIAKMRRIYRERRAELQVSVGNAPGDCTLRGLNDGLHAFLDIGSEATFKLLSERATEARVKLADVRIYAVGEMSRKGFVIGFGNVETGKIEKALSRVFG